MSIEVAVETHKTPLNVEATEKFWDIFKLSGAW